MHSEFDSTLSEIEVSAERRRKEMLAPVIQQIGRMQKLLDGLRTSAAGSDSGLVDEVFEQDEGIDQERIRRLELAVRDKNKSRLMALLSLKQQLRECVSTLEDLEQSHPGQIDRLRRRLQTSDSKYERRLKEGSERHWTDTAELTRRIAETNKGVARIEAEIGKFREGHASQMLELAQATDQARMELHMVTAREPPSRKHASEAMQWQAKLEDLKRDLEDRDQVLAQERQNNMALKREISRVKAAARIAERRSVLNL
jgi:cell division protein FtsB